MTVPNVARRHRGRAFTSLSILSSLVATVAVAAAAAGCASADGTSESADQTSQRLDARVRAVGRLLCKGAPLANVRVDMMNSNSDTDTISDQYMGTGYTDANGNFSFEGTGGDSGNWSWSGPDVYVRAVYDTYVGPSRVRVTNELDNARVDETPQHDHDNQSAGAVVQIGVRNFGSSDCALWQNATSAVRDFQTVTGTQIPAGHYDIERWSAIYSGTPWTNLDTTHWPTNYDTYLTTSFHEFGHSVRHSLDGDSNHFNWDVTRFVYARYHSPSDKTNEGFAFNEGWAEYWATRGGSWVGFQNPANDWEVEGNVAAQLQVLSRCYGMNDAKMVNVLRGHAGAIHSMEEFNAVFNQLYPGACRPRARLPPGALTAAAASPMAHDTPAPAPIADQAHAPETHDQAENKSNARSPRAALAGITMEAIQSHVADGTYDGWKNEMRASIVAEAIAAKRASLGAAIQALASGPDSAETRARIADLRTNLDDVRAIEDAVARGEAPPLGLQP